MTPRDSRAAIALVVMGAVEWASAMPLTPLEEAGRRLYRDGIGRAGEPVVAMVGIMATPVRGSQVPCAGCHGRDGRGRVEGGVRPPNIAWRELVRENGHRHSPGPGGPERIHPPFDSRTFQRAVGEGLDPAGNRLDPAMPRYRLSSADLAGLEAYLKRIEGDHDPGVSDQAVRIGTLLPKSGPLAASSRSVERVLRAVIDATNATGGVHGRRIDLQVFDAGSGAAAGRAALAEIERAGVFALLAPLAPALEAELIALCEAKPLTLIGMMPPVRPVSEPRNVWHLAAGPSERAAALAEFAIADLDAGRKKVSIVLGPGIRAAAQADRVDAQFAARGLPHPSRESFAAGRSGDVVAGLQLRTVPLVFFLGETRDLADFLARTEEAEYRPHVLVADPSLPNLPDHLSSRVHVASGLLPTDFGAEMLTALRQESQRPGMVEATAWAVATTAVEALKRSGRALSIDAFQGALQSLSGFSSGATPPVSFTGGRRMGTGGAWVLPASSGSGRDGARFVIIDRIPG